MFGLKPEVIEIFTPFIKYVDGWLIFRYGKEDIESWEAGRHRVPSTSELWLAVPDHTNLVTDLYISYTAAELLCFASQRSFNLLKHPEQHAFAAIGLLPSAAQVDTLKIIFPSARWHLIFGTSLISCIKDAFIATRFKGRSVSFRVSGEQVVITYDGKPYDINCEIFSLNRFERVTGLRSGMRTHKPLSGLSSFIELQFAEQ